MGQDLGFYRAMRLPLTAKHMRDSISGQNYPGTSKTDLNKELITAMPSIQTVTGPIDPQDMGVTYAHEHLLGGPPDWSPDGSDGDLVMTSTEAATKELGLFKLAGGRTMVEMSTPDYRRQPDKLRELSRDAGINIIMTTGLHKDAYSQRETASATVDELVARFTADVKEGVNGVRAGVIKAATSQDLITEGERKVLTAAARAHNATGAPISTHTQGGTMGLEQIAAFRAEGVDPTLVVIGHVDRKLDYDYHKAMLDTGANLIYDHLSKEKYAPDSLRVAMLMRLIEEGYGGQLMLSGDFGRSSYYTSTGGGPGFTYILWRFVPWLLSEGVSKEAVNKLMVENPARIFAF
jgi:predicted metal-dependent phosphotriesterase family hydrolase